MTIVQIPIGWKTVRMDEVGTLYCGQSPSTSNVNREGVGTPYFTGPEQWDGSVLHLDKWTTDPRRLVPDGCIFITVKGAGVGKLFAGKAGAIGRDVYAFKPHDGISRRFVEYSLRFNIEQLVRHAKGDIPGLSKAHILDHLTMLPPLAEQRRIVSKIEELFSDLDAGVKSLERAKANLKAYRSSVLKAAVEGRLTADWRAAHPDIEPASKSAKHNSKYRALETLNEPSEICFTDSVWRPIHSVIETLSQGWSPKCEQVPSDSHDTWAVIKTSAVMPMQYIEEENKKLPDKLTPREHLEVKPNDLLITRAGPRNRAAVTCLVKSTRPKLIVCDKVYRVGVRQDVAIPAYLEVVLNAPQILKELNEMKTGISDSGVSLTQDRFRDLRIPVPSLPEQLAILELVDEKLSRVDACDKLIEKSTHRATRLRQSILKTAFVGRLQYD